MVADSDGDFKDVVLICDGSNWQAAEYSASGPFEYSSSAGAFAIVGNDIPGAVGILDGTYSNYPSTDIHLIGYSSSGRMVIGFHDIGSSSIMGMTHISGDNIFLGSYWDIDDPLGATGIKINDEDYDFYFYGSNFMRLSDGWQMQLGSQTNTASFASDLVFKRGRATNNPTQTGDLLGTVSWAGKYNTATNLYSELSADAQIRAVVDTGTIDITIPTKLIFSTTGVGSLTEQMVILGNGNVGIGNPSPSVALDVVGDIHYTGVIQDVSDQRLKENVTSLEGSLEGLLRLNGYSFTMKGDDSAVVEYGLMAQEVEPVFPELVTTQDDGFKSMNYIGLIAPLVEATKAQQALIEAQQAQIDELTARLHALEDK